MKTTNQIATAILQLISLASCEGSIGSDPMAQVTSHPVLTAALTPPRVVLEGRARARRLASAPLGAGGPSGGGQVVAGEAAFAMAADLDGAQYLALLVSCALPGGESLVSGDLEFFGELGLSSSWARRPLDDDDRGWISACVLARLNGDGVALPISLRGRLRLPRPGSEEIAEFPVWAGSFYGDVFSSLDRPIEWFTCRGSGQISHPSASGLLGTCALEDPDRAGLSPCGMQFTGDCADVFRFGRRRGLESHLEFINLFVIE
jgi:hypothetical protein